MKDENLKLEMAELILKTVADCPHCSLCRNSAKQYISCTKDDEAEEGDGKVKKEEIDKYRKAM